MCESAEKSGSIGDLAARPLSGSPVGGLDGSAAGRRRKADLRTIHRARVHPGRGMRTILVTDAVFSMRGDHAPLDRIAALVRAWDERFSENAVLVVDDSHGVGARGASWPPGSRIWWRRAARTSCASRSPRTTPPPTATSCSTPSRA